MGEVVRFPRGLLARRDPFKDASRRPDLPPGIIGETGWAVTCDWGHCDSASVDWRWAYDLGMWLAVCESHADKGSAVELTSIDCRWCGLGIHWSRINGGLWLSNEGSYTACPNQQPARRHEPEHRDVPLEEN